MELLKVLSSKKNKITVQGVELYLKKLNWKELNNFQEFSAEVEKNTSDANSTVKVCVYILENYISDAKGGAVIDSSDVEDLPVDFCVDLR